MLTDFQLQDLCEKMKVPLEEICFKDELPSKIKLNKAYIINMENELDEYGKPNTGSHWVCLQVNKYANGKYEPFYFDSYGMPPPEYVKKVVRNTTGQYLPYSTKDIQSLMNNACGFYCLALLHYLNAYPHRKKNLYEDVEDFLFMFDDLNKSVDFKKNEYILKHFFVPEDPKLRKPIEVDVETIVSKEGGDLMEVPVNVKTV
jgi:hypothetical protein